MDHRTSARSAVDGGRPAVEVDRVSFGYGSTYVLYQVSMTVDVGEFVSVIGPSGCGKSTLLQLLDGSARPDSGSVGIGGQGVDDGALRRSVVYQGSALMPWKTVLDNVLLGLKYRRGDLSRKQRTVQAEEFLGRVGLGDALHLYPHQLSGGMQQRAGLARAFAIDPELLLMDEPFAAVDAQNAEILREDLATLVREQGCTVVFITHNLDEALSLSDRILLMQAHPGSICDEIRVEVGDGTESQRRERREAYRDQLWSHLRTQVVNPAERGAVR